MAGSYTRMTRKGQTTVRAAVRAALGLKEGDRIEVELSPEGDPTLRLLAPGRLGGGTDAGCIAATQRPPNYHQGNAPVVRRIPGHSGRSCGGNHRGVSEFIDANI